MTSEHFERASQVVVSMSSGGRKETGKLWRYWNEFEYIDHPPKINWKRLTVVVRGGCRELISDVGSTLFHFFTVNYRLENRQFFVRKEWRSLMWDCVLVETKHRMFFSLRINAHAHGRIIVLFASCGCKVSCLHKNGY